MEVYIASWSLIAHTTKVAESRMSNRRYILGPGTNGEISCSQPRAQARSAEGVEAKSEQSKDGFMQAFIIQLHLRVKEICHTATQNTCNLVVVR